MDWEGLAKAEEVDEWIRTAKTPLALEALARPERFGAAELRRFFLTSCWYGRRDAMNRLVDLVDPEPIAAQALAYAARNGHAKILEDLFCVLEVGKELRGQLLCEAADGGGLRCAEFLLSRGQVAAADAGAALRCAALKEKKEICLLLLKEKLPADALAQAIAESARRGLAGPLEWLLPKAPAQMKFKPLVDECLRKRWSQGAGLLARWAPEGENWAPSAVLALKKGMDPEFRALASMALNRPGGARALALALESSGLDEHSKGIASACIDKGALENAVPQRQARAPAKARRM